LKRLIALDQEEFNAIMDLATAHTTYMPSYQTVSFPEGFHYVFGSAETEEVEKILILGAAAGLASP